VPICRWVLAAAARSLAKFQAAAKGALDGHGELGISVNVTKHQVEDAETIAVIDRIPGDSGISPGQLKLELTEGVLMDDFARARDWIAELKQRHIKLSIDDFGTGYSSLGYLHQLRVDELKIDRSFVGQMLREPRSMEIVRAIIGLAHGLGLRTVAEGIEQQAQAERLNEIGCDLGQGYHFARPMPEADVMAMMGEGGFRFAR
jgi:EAL domain-containing protein (putative c-di-GMP-specific phosphodiesterase class I)